MTFCTSSSERRLTGREGQLASQAEQRLKESCHLSAGRKVERTLLGRDGRERAQLSPHPTNVKCWRQGGSNN